MIVVLRMLVVVFLLFDPSRTSEWCKCTVIGQTRASVSPTTGIKKKKYYVKCWPCKQQLENIKY